MLFEESEIKYIAPSVWENDDLNDMLFLEEVVH